MTSFQTRYSALNPKQRQAVDRIDGPLMVVAGPGTGKTELLSMRAANILKKTDTLPSNILCLTFTESGATAMRERLHGIIGADAYKVSIQTFHGFGSDIISRFPDYFYSGARFQPVDELSRYRILREIFDELRHDSPLGGMMNDEYVHLRATLSAISELKRSGLTSDELLAVLDDNERIYDETERQLRDVFASKISKETAETLVPIATYIAERAQAPLPPTIQSIVPVLSLSISRAIDDAQTDNSTKPITAWRNRWLEKNADGEFVFKDRKRLTKLRALAHVYYRYLEAMQAAELYDFDDMVLRVVHALEIYPDLRFNLQEQYQYLMVDEFQDTNLAQMRILESLTMLPTGDAPNIMVVGDDDQAIYSFQGADVDNIMQFHTRFSDLEIISLTDNYRSHGAILSAAHDVIAYGTNRLEHLLDSLDKTLSAHHEKGGQVSLDNYATETDERKRVAEQIASLISSGARPESIAVLARRHHELIELLPFLHAETISVNYERRNSVLELETIKILELTARTIHAIATNQFASADSFLPELLSHPAWGISPTALWKLSQQAYNHRVSWLEEMSTDSSFSHIHEWFVERAAASHHTSLETELDAIFGTLDAKPSTFTAPYSSYYFDEKKLEYAPDCYLEHLEALRTLREKLREFAPEKSLRLADFLDFLDSHRRLDTTITSVRPVANDVTGNVHLMTAHGAKGLEYDHVFIIGAVDSAWGERVRTPPQLISYPENLPLAMSGNNFDDRLRLFFVAMTRAKQSLHISFARQSDGGKPLVVASFLSDSAMPTEAHDADTSPAIQQAINEISWRQTVSTPETSLRDLLSGTLENYRLSATHLTNFLDVTHGGPRGFLLNNLLHFPSAISPNAAYGSAIHRTLNQAHRDIARSREHRPIEDIVHDFEENLRSMRMSDADFSTFLSRGSDYLQRFLSLHYDSFKPTQRSEVDFRAQHSVVAGAKLTGSLDLIDVDNETKRITVTDYKTGRPSLDWKGKSDYEKIKLHHYRQQLLFYKLLIENARDYAAFTVDDAMLAFIEPLDGVTLRDGLHIEFSSDELETFSKLIGGVWKRIIALDLPDTSEFSADYKGILAFEQSLLDNK